MDTKPASTEAAEVGRNIRRERKRLKLTGDDIWKLASIDPTSLSFFERGIREPNVRHLRRLAKVFGVPLAAFFRSPRVAPVPRRARRSGQRVPQGS